MGGQVSTPSSQNPSPAAYPYAFQSASHPIPTAGHPKQPQSFQARPATGQASLSSAEMASTKKLLEDFASIANVGFEFLGKEHNKGSQALEDFVKFSKVGFELMGEEQKKGGLPSFLLAYKDEAFREIVWNQLENCVGEGQKNGEKQGDIVMKCFNAKALMRRCLEASPDYCEPRLKAQSEILSAEKEALEEVLLELKMEQKKKKGGFWSRKSS